MKMCTNSVQSWQYNVQSRAVDDYREHYLNVHNYMLHINTRIYYVHVLFVCLIGNPMIL